MSQPITSERHKLFNRPSKGNHVSQKQLFLTAVSGLKTIAEFVDQVTNVVDIGPPGLRTGLTGLVFVLDAIQVSDHTHLRILLDNKP